MQYGPRVQDDRSLKLWVFVTDGSADGVPNAQSWENADKEIDENLYTGVNICFIPKAKL